MKCRYERLGVSDLSWLCTSFLIVILLGCSGGLLPLGARSFLAFGGIKSTQAEPDNVRLYWDRVSGVSAYVAYRVENGTATEIGTASDTASVFTVSDLTKNTSYTFRVQARDASGKSDGNTNDVTVTTPATVDFSGLPETASGDFLAYWRASTGVTKDSNDRVSRWADLSGNGYDLINTPGNNDPLWTEAMINGLPALQFSEIPLFNNDLTYIGPGLGFTLLAVISPIIENPHQSFLVNNGLSPVSLGVTRMGLSYFAGYMVESEMFSTLTLEPNRFFILSYQGSEANNEISVYVWRNGTPTENGGVAPTNNNVDPGARVGEDSSDYIAELLLYDRTLNEEERKDAERYLADRYAITLEQ